MKKTKRYEDGGYLLDSEGKRVKSGSGDDVRSGSYDKEADMESARKKLAQDVQSKLKADKAAKDDADFAEADRVSSTARSVAGKPASKTAPSAKAKSGIVTKEELAKSGLTLREYMNKQQGKTARGGAPAKAQSKASTPAVSSSYRSEGANKAKSAVSSGSASSAAPAKKSTYETPYDRYGRKKAEEEAKVKSERDEFNKKLAKDPGQIALKKEQETKDTRSAAERSADRGRSIKEFFGVNTKKPLDAKGATIQSMDTDMMRTAGRTAAKEQGQKRKVESESGYKSGGSVRGAGIAQRGVRKCKMV